MGRALRGCGLVLKKKPHTKTAVLVLFLEFFTKWCRKRFWKCGCGTTAKTAVAYLTRVDA